MNRMIVKIETRFVIILCILKNHNPNKNITSASFNTPEVHKTKEGKKK